MTCDKPTFNAKAIFHGSDAESTRLMYRTLEAIGPVGIVALELFRAQKASSRAKVYRRRFVRGAYDKKQWSLGNLVAVLLANPIDGIVWGWGEDKKTYNFPWVLYVELPVGQVSFHSPCRGDGPTFQGQWDGARGESHKRIVAWVQHILDANPWVEPAPMPDQSAELADDSPIPFGKHKKPDAACRNLPDDYLEWFLGQPWRHKWAGLIVYAEKRLASHGKQIPQGSPQLAATSGCVGNPYAPEFNDGTCPFVADEKEDGTHEA